MDILLCYANFNTILKQSHFIYKTIVSIFYFHKMKQYKLNFSSSKMENKNIIEKQENPKRLQREINKELKKKTIGTKAQIALSKAYEENKIERKKKSKAYKEMEKERQFAIKQLKKKEKHKGH